MPWIVNATRDEYLQFRRALAREKKYPGMLWQWIKEHFGENAARLAILQRAHICVRPTAKKIPSKFISRVASVSKEELERLQRESDAAMEDYDGGKGCIPGVGGTPGDGEDAGTSANHPGG